MGYRFRGNDRYYNSGPGSREEDDYYHSSRGPPPPYPSRERRFEERRFMREIATKALFLSAKKFYLDIVEGSVGKLLKLSEVAQTGQKSKMFMDLEVAVEFHDKISDFCDFLSNLDKNVDREKGHNSEPLKNETMVKEQRRYYLDLMENHRGMFLKVTMRSPTTERIQLVFPASGLPEVRDALTDLLSEHGSNKRRKISESGDRPVQASAMKTDSKEEKTESVGNDSFCQSFDDEFQCSVSIDVAGAEEEMVLGVSEEVGNGEKKPKEPTDGNKLNCKDRAFQFEVKTNKTGVYLSITESSNKFRSVINVPQKCWQEFVTNIEEKLEGHHKDPKSLTDANSRSERAK